VFGILGKFSVWQNRNLYVPFILFFAFILKYYLFFRMFAVVINVNHIIKDFI